MNELRNDDTLTTADIANQNRRRGATDVIDETDVDPVDRVPPPLDINNKAAIDEAYSQSAGNRDAADWNADSRSEAPRNEDMRGIDRERDMRMAPTMPPPQHTVASDRGLEPQYIDDPSRIARPAPPIARAAQEAANAGAGSISKARSEMPQSGAASPSSAAGFSSHGNSETSEGSLFPNDELASFRIRWDQVQTSFVDEPQRAVEQADSLVANVVKRIAEQFSEERARLENQWDGGGDVSTEDLRQSLRRYRAFFDRLLSV